MGAIDTYPPQNITAQTPTLAYAEVVAAQPSISSEVNITGLTVTFTIPAGRRVKVSVKGRVDNDATAGNVLIRVFEGATELGRIFEDNVTAGDYRTAESSIVLSPTAGTHTYQVKGWKDTGAGVFGWNAWSTNPSYILVEDITGSPLPVLPQSVPVGRLAYSEITSTWTLGVTATATLIPGLSVNVAVPAGRTLRITAMAHARSTVATDAVYVGMQEDGVGKGFNYINESSTVNSGSAMFVATVSPSAGAHTYAMVVQRQNGTGGISVYADPVSPSWIMVEDITPTPAPASGTPSSTLGYAEIVANSVGFTAVTDITGLSVTVTVPAGRRIRVSAKGALAATAGTPGWGSMYIYESGVMKGNWRIDTPLNVSEGAAPSVVLSPSAGTHTYYVRAECDTGTCVVAANGNEPAYILVEDITGTSTTVTPGTVGGGSSTLAYSQVVATQNVTNTVAPGDNLTGLATTVTVPAGRRLKITGYGFFSNGTSATARFVILDEANNYLADSGAYINSAGATEITALAVITPTEGTHTYRLAARTTAGTLTFGGYTTIPGFILVEDITGVSTPVQPTSVPVGTLAYNQMASDVTGITTAYVDLTTINVVVTGGRQVRIRGWVPLQSTAVGDQILLAIREGSTVLKYAEVRPALANVAEAFEVEMVLSPSAGSHTYSLSATRGFSATGTISAVGTSTRPGHFYAEDITATPAPSSGAPGSALAYAEKITNQTSITTEVDVTGLAVTVTVPAGRLLKITGSVLARPGVANDELMMLIREGGTQLQAIAQTLPNTARDEQFTREVLVTPTAGTHTYRLTFKTSSGGGSAQITAGTGFPSFILVEDVTGSVWPAGSPVTTGMIASEAWGTFTPIWTAAGGAAPAIGNGAVTCRYTKIGRTVIGVMRLTPGSTTTFGTAGNRWLLSLPVAPSTAINIWPVIGVGKLWGSPSSQNVVIRIDAGSSNLSMWYHTTWPGGPEAGVGQGNPWTWVNGYDIDIQFMYEAAS